MTGTRTQLDFILVRKKWRNSVLNTEAYESSCNVGSDHRLVASKVRLSLRKKAILKKIQPNWSVLRTDANLQVKFTVTVKNKFSALSTEDIEDPEIVISDPTKLYGDWIKTVNETAKDRKPTHPKTLGSLMLAMKSKIPTPCTVWIPQMTIGTKSNLLRTTSPRCMMLYKKRYVRRR